MSEVESLPNFLKRTAETPPGPLLATLCTKAKTLGLFDFDAPAELARMKSYIARFYEDVRPVASYAHGEGHIIDCVPYDQQPEARSARAAGHELLAIAPPPAPMPGAEPEAATGPCLAPTTGPCPPGTVPITRVTLEHLVSLGTLENYFHKTPGPAPNSEVP